MLCRSTSLFAALFSILLSGANISPATANIFTDIWSIATDPLKLNASSSTLSSSIQRSLTQLDLMENVANNHVAERLNQIRSITDSIVIGSQQTIDKATADMLALKSKIDNDAVDLIYEVKCATDITFAQGRQTFADIVSDLGRADPGVYILGIKIVDLRTKNIEILYPDQAYNDLKKRQHKKLKTDVTDDSQAAQILSYYANLENMAKYKLCFYKDQPSKIEWVQEISNIERLQVPWTTVVLPKM